MDKRRKNSSWLLNMSPDNTCSNEDARLAVLMDIRDELQGIRRRLDCGETLQIPSILKSIRANTSKRNRKK